MNGKLIIVFILHTILIVVTSENIFPLGKQRSYTFSNVVKLLDFKNGPTVGYKLTGKIKVGSIWTAEDHSLLKFQFHKPKLYVKPQKGESLSVDDEYVEVLSTLEKGKNNEFFAVWNNGKIVNVFISEKEDEALVNLKKAIVSLFQYQLRNGIYPEQDISGECDTLYVFLPTGVLRKNKLLCMNNETYHSRKDSGMAVSKSLNIDTRYTLTKNGIVEQIKAENSLSLFLEANNNVGAKVINLIDVDFDGSITDVLTIKGKSLRDALGSLRGVKEQSLLGTVQKQCIGDQCKSFKSVVKEVKNDLINKKIGTAAAALALVKMVPVARKTSKDEFLKVLNAHTMQDLKGQLLDLLAATQTEESHRAARDILNFSDENDFDNIERYLQGLAVGSRPQVKIIEDLLYLPKVDKIPVIKIMDTVKQTISSMINRYAKLSELHNNSTFVFRGTEFLQDILKDCKSVFCSEMSIRAMANLKSPLTIGDLIQEAYSKEVKLSVAAMKALRNYPKDFWTDDHKKKFQDIFYQLTNKFDSSARTLALDILLDLEPNEIEIMDLLEYLRSNDKAFEVKQYLLQKLILVSENNAKFNEILKRVFWKNSQFNNYDILAQKGLTTVMAREFSKYPSFNGTLLSIQEVNNGILKRGLVDITTDINGDKFSVFSLGLNANGLSSFVGGSGEEDSETATAGMQISVQGSHFRPLVFFTGTSELMGHVWSGTASESTAAYTATTMLQDHQQTYRLQNGDTISVDIYGAVSIDLNGQFQLSLWSSVAHCQIDQNAAFAVSGSVNVNSGFAFLQSDFVVTQDAKTNLVSDINYSSDINICLQLQQPESVLRHDISKLEKVIGTKRKRSYFNKMKYNLPGRTHVLNQKNNEMCNKIFANS